MPNGIVKFFNAAKKFGFVSPDDGGKDVFVPLASVTAAGIAGLIPGQRIAFETAPDARGPKAINLKVLETPAPVSAPAPAPAARKVLLPKPQSSGPRLTYYYDSSSDYAVRTLAELRKGAFDLRAIDYVATPPKVEELKRLSMYLPGGSLVRRYDSLFHELRLDDRFIGQNEFWNGVFENPTLINGPILATATRTCICEDDEDVTEFLESISPGLSRSMTEERVQPERVATPVLEAPKEEVQLALLDVEDDEDDAADEEPEVADEVTDVESEATDEEADATDDEAETTPAKRLAKKPVKAAEKKNTTAKAAAPKVAKKTVSKPAAKTTKAKAK